MPNDTLPFDQWLAGTTQNATPANDNALRSEVLAAYVISKTTTAQPGSPSDGDLYIIPAGATGTQWAAFAEDSLAYYRGGTWYEFVPFFGMVKNVAGTLEEFTDIGSSSSSNPAWAPIVAGGGTGDVVGPGSATADAVVLFDGTTGKLVKDSSTTIAQIRSIPQNSQSAAYTTVLSDAGKHILHPSADTTARTFTIDSNANVPYPIGTAITFINQNGAGTVTIAITSDMMRLAGAGTTGSRTLAANGIATAVKITSTEWIISGTGLT